jgi:hypothetical protein
VSEPFSNIWLDRIRVALAAFHDPLRPGLLRILTLPDDERAQAIGEMFQEGVTPNLAELLIDLEEEPALRATVVRELQSLIRGSPDTESIPHLLEGAGTYAV